MCMEKIIINKYRLVSLGFSLIFLFFSIQPKTSNNIQHSYLCVFNDIHHCLYSMVVIFCCKIVNVAAVTVAVATWLVALKSGQVCGNDGNDNENSVCGWLIKLKILQIIMVYG